VHTIPGLKRIHLGLAERARSALSNVFQSIRNVICSAPRDLCLKPFGTLVGCFGDLNRGIFQSRLSLWDTLDTHILEVFEATPSGRNDWVWTALREDRR
jgi:hypothetical protein